MKNVYKWRIINTKYIYITDENGNDPFIYDKLTAKRTYFSEATEILNGIPNDGKIATISAAFDYTKYSNNFTKLVELCKSDSDGKMLTFLSVDNYFNIDASECVTKATTPVCEGYDPVVNVSAITVEAGENASADLNVERYDADKTIHYDLTLKIPKGEEGPMGPEGCGLQGEKGDKGDNAKFGNITAELNQNPTIKTPNVTLITGETSGATDMHFIFNLPSPKNGQTGIRGPRGYDGLPALFGYFDVSALTIDSWEQASVDVTATTKEIDNKTDLKMMFKVPKGEAGPVGEMGLPATIVGASCTTHMIPSGTPASVTATTTVYDAENNMYALNFDFALPWPERGEDGQSYTGGTGSGGYVYNFHDIQFIPDTIEEPIGDYDVFYHPNDGSADVYTQIIYPESWGQGGGGINWMFEPGKPVKFNRLYTHDEATNEEFFNENAIYFTYVSGDSKENRTIIMNGHEYGREIPLSHHKLPYTELVDVSGNTNQGVDAIIQRQFMYDGSDETTDKFYVVDKQEDFDICVNTEIEPDIKNEWKQFSYSMLDCEYGNGYSTSVNEHKGSGASGKCGFGYWSSGTSYNIITNPCNSSDFNGYINPETLKYFNFQSLIGTDKGQTTGDILGFALINDKNAIPRNFIASDNNIYYRNSLYDLDYTNAITGSGGEKYWCAWVCEDKNNNSARIIYGQHVQSTKSINNFSDSLNYYDIFPSRNLEVYKTNNILNKKQRTNTIKTEDIVFIANPKTDCHESSGYLVTLNFACCNSTNIQGVYGKKNGTNGSVFAWLEYFSLNENDSADTINNHYLQNTESGYFDACKQGSEGGRQGYLFIDGSTSVSTNNVLGGQNIVKYESSLDGCAKNLFEFIRTNSYYDNGILTIKFSNPSGNTNISLLETSLQNYKDIWSYNNSELVIDFKEKTFTCKMLNGATISSDLPSATAKAFYDGQTYLKEVDLWDGFDEETKIMYFAESYANIYIKCTSLQTSDYLILRTDNDSVWKLDKSTQTYEMVSGESPINYFYGSHMAYNDLTKKLWYSNGKYIYELLTGGDCCKYGNFYEEIRYDKLKELRDNDLLRKGKQYRIIDYECTTSTIGTISAGHNFDIIVTADDVNKLNENARAVLHEGDTYFANSKLEAWEIKYCLDNDKNRFAWASDANELETIMIPSDITVSSKTITVKLDFETVKSDEIIYKTININTGIGYIASVIYNNGLNLQSVSKININLDGFEDIIGLTDQYVISSKSTTKIIINQVNLGKGVIWYMKDEWNNECPYDFKNIMFINGASFMYTFSLPNENYRITFRNVKDYNKEHRDNQDYDNICKDGSNYIINEERGDVYADLISYNEITKKMKFLQMDWKNQPEYIIENISEITSCYNFNVRSMWTNSFNVDGRYMCTYDGPQDYTYNYTQRILSDDLTSYSSNLTIKNVVNDSSLNDINYVNNNIISQNRLNNNITAEIYGTTLLSTFDYSEILHLPFNIFIGKKINGNKLGNDCSNNIFYTGCKDNMLMANCRNNIFYPFSEKNLLQDNCCLNIFCVQSNSNTLKDYCYNNQFLNCSGGNTLGYGCYYIFIGSNTTYCTFGDRCRDIWTGPYKLGFSFVADSNCSAIVYGNDETEYSISERGIYKIPRLSLLSKCYLKQYFGEPIYMKYGKFLIDNIGGLEDYNSSDINPTYPLYTHFIDNGKFDNEIEYQYGHEYKQFSKGCLILMLIKSDGKIHYDNINNPISIYTHIYHHDNRN